MSNEQKISPDANLPINTLITGLKYAEQDRPLPFTENDLTMLFKLNGEVPDGLTFIERCMGEGTALDNDDPLQHEALFYTFGLLSKAKKRDMTEQERILASYLINMAVKQVEREGNICKIANYIVERSPNEFIDPEKRAKILASPIFEANQNQI